MFQRLPSADDLNGTGFVPEDYALPPVEVWPENWEAFCFFASLRTQWRSDMGYLTGLDYQAVKALMDLHEMPQCSRLHVMEEVQAMENAAITQMAVKYT